MDPSKGIDPSTHTSIVVLSLQVCPGQGVLTRLNTTDEVSNVDSLPERVHCHVLGKIGEKHTGHFRSDTGVESGFWLAEGHRDLVEIINKVLGCGLESK